jgi:peptidoglycan-associated lipoprotein
VFFVLIFRSSFQKYLGDTSIMNTFKKIATLAAITSMLLAGCGSNVKLEDKQAPVENRTSSDGAANGGASSSQVASVDLSKGSAGAAAGRVIYFELDSYVVKDEYRSMLETQAKTLTNNRGKKLTVEGHTDARGGSEYNLALGQKRAQAVVKTLVVLGASESQIEAVSFGKERPAVAGGDETAWAKNRRAEVTSR